MGRAVTGLRRHILNPLRNFLADSRSVGILLIICTICSLLFSNLSSTGATYTAFWQHETAIGGGFIHLPHNILAWINDVCMALFFFLVGTEIKRELSQGELSSLKKSLLPILAALGGMVCPALIFLVFNGDTSFQHGWGIPMATDIAFSLGVLSLLGKKVPVQLKIFLAALAIIDDLGAVVTIAVFYTSALKLMYLFIALVILGAVIVMNRYNLKNPLYYLLPGVLLWYCIYNSGVHATIAGVLMAFAMPLSSLARVEPALHRPVNFIIMPLFALANTAIALPADIGFAFTSTVSFGIMLGLIIGKPVGIFLFSFVAAKLKIASLPSNTNYKQLLGIGILGGIGFTMSIFTSTLAYSQETLQVISKVSIISASVVSAVAGYAFFYLSKSQVALPVMQKIERLAERESYEELPALEHAVA